ncbi:MAG: Lrp/AsnC family transcriptional regulator [Gammaproteobacteria bacterium]|jgi:DNA-binding Lrp family transcriptional regulator
MDKIDRALVNVLQDGLPVVEHPFAAIAGGLGIAPADVVVRVRQLLDDGYLSRFGPMFDAEKMGGAVTLCAMQVPADAFDRVAAQINAFPEVAHNYEREHVLNMWFVVSTDDPRQLQAVIERIEEIAGYPVYDMPKIEEFFVGLRLEV